MSDLEVFRLSALACGAPNPRIAAGKCVFDGFVDMDGLATWNPFTNAEQRWECVTKLLQHGKIILLDSEDGGYLPDKMGRLPVCVNCPAEEFPARALAELESRNAR